MKTINLVCKVGSTALLNKDKTDIDVSVLKNICTNLTSSDILVSSGAVELGKIDYAKHNNISLDMLGNLGMIRKNKLAARGQVILMNKYRQYFDKHMGIEQLLVEHRHFNNLESRRSLQDFFLGSALDNTITIVNYNDAVDKEELRKIEIAEFKAENGEAVELVDNDETAVAVAKLVGAKTLLILTQLDGIYRDINDKSSLIREICGFTIEETVGKIRECQGYCNGVSRAGANGAGAKLDYVTDAIRNGIEVFIASSHSDIKDILNGHAKSTRIAVGNSYKIKDKRGN